MRTFRQYVEAQTNPGIPGSMANAMLPNMNVSLTGNSLRITSMDGKIAIPIPLTEPGQLDTVKKQIGNTTNIGRANVTISGNSVQIQTYNKSVPVQLSQKQVMDLQMRMKPYAQYIQQNQQQQQMNQQGVSAQPNGSTPANSMPPTAASVQTAISGLPH